MGKYMEDFVPYKLAVKLKKKGFNEGCYKYYENKELKWSNSPWLEVRYNNYMPHITSAPTISQILKWLRKEKEIYINIVSYFSYAPKNNVAFAFCARYKEGDDWRDVEINESYLTYEECALAGIEYTLDNLI